jgi:Uma2 family endonuclease
MACRGIFEAVSATVTPYPKLSATEYLAWERAQRDKHQFLNGCIYAMAGGSPRHNLIGANLIGQLHAALRGTGRRLFNSDQKIYFPASGDFVYPDGSVVCGPVRLHEGTSDVIENPTVVIEVLSKSTEQHDRGDKWEGYRSIPSLTDYVLISQRLPRLEHFARESDGSWRYRVVGAGGRLDLTTGAALLVDELYAGALDVPGDE